MKLIFTLVFTFLTFSGSFHLIHDVDHSDAISISQSLLQRASLSNNSDSSFPHKNTDSESVCYHCHIGHCSFPIESSYVLPLSLYKGLLFYLDINIATSNFQSSPFRPPIS